MLSLRVLKTFLAVIDTGSVIGAARLRGYSAAAVSRQMAGLQRGLGVELFLPEGRGIRPSAHAIHLAARSRVLIAEAEAVEGYLRELRDAGSPRAAAVNCPTGSGDGIPGRQAISRLIALTSV